MYIRIEQSFMIQIHRLCHCITILSFHQNWHFKSVQSMYRRMYMNRLLVSGIGGAKEEA